MRDRTPFSFPPVQTDPPHFIPGSRQKGTLLSPAHLPPPPFFSGARKRGGALWLPPSFGRRTFFLQGGRRMTLYQRLPPLFFFFTTSEEKELEDPAFPRPPPSSPRRAFPSLSPPSFKGGKRKSLAVFGVGTSAFFLQANKEKREMLFLPCGRGILSPRASFSPPSSPQKRRYQRSKHLLPKSLAWVFLHRT